MYGKNMEPPNLLKPMYKNLTWIQRYNRTQFYYYFLLWNTAFWIQKPLYARECYAALSEILNIATCHKEAHTGQKCRATVQHSLACEGPIFMGPLCRQTCPNPPLVSLANRNHSEKGSSSSRKVNDSFNQKNLQFDEFTQLYGKTTQFAVHHPLDIINKHFCFDNVNYTESTQTDKSTHC